MIAEEERKSGGESVEELLLRRCYARLMCLTGRGRVEHALCLVFATFQGGSLWFLMCKIAIEGGKPLNRVCRSEMYNSIAQSTLFSRIAKFSIDDYAKDSSGEIPAEMHCIL